MRIGRRVSLMQRHSPLSRPRPLSALQPQVSLSLTASFSLYRIELLAQTVFSIQAGSLYNYKLGGGVQWRLFCSKGRGLG